MPGPCSNCCVSRQPCLGGDCSAPPAQRDYDLSILIELRVTLRARAFTAEEAWRLLQQKGLRWLAREAWRRGERRLMRGGVTVVPAPKRPKRP